MPAGRPTKYRPEYCEMIIEHMAKGLSKEAFAGVIGIHKETIYNWAEANSEFSDAIKIGEAKCRVFWEQAGIDGMMGNIEGFNAASWVFNLKNRFGWRDRQEVTGENGAPFTVRIVKHTDE